MYKYEGSRPAYQIDAEGNRYVNFLDYNNGEGIRANIAALNVYVVDEYNNEIFEKVAEYRVLRK
ncbi:hypothetical protein [Bacillus cereus]|uniref:hypothetical protein n=1 Tax=Bacillus cereus TaxID=1396 RepID=UPI000BFA502A|nr:hypothetical protein COJ69_30220 [Bacillus cereus]